MSERTLSKRGQESLPEGEIFDKLVEVPIISHDRSFSKIIDEW